MSKKENQQKEENQENKIKDENQNLDTNEIHQSKDGSKDQSKDDGVINPNANKNEEKINDLTNLLKRVQAEFSNYMKRTENEKSFLIKNANKNLILKLIPILDNFELALKNVQNNENNDNDKNLFEGINMVYLQLLDILQGEGLSFIENKTFDPNYHEAISIEESDHDDGTILEVLRNGYMLNGIVLRHSLVKVSKKEKK